MGIMIECTATLGFPPCFGSLTYYLAWVEARYDADAEVVQSYCHDCTPAFQAGALGRGECLHPETRFLEVWGDENDKETIGVR